MVRLEYLQKLQLEIDLTGDPEFWALPSVTRFQRLGLRLAAKVPTALAYEDMDSDGRRDCLLRLLQLGISSVNALDIRLNPGDMMREPPAGYSREFGHRIASIAGDFANAGEMMDRYASFARLAESSAKALVAAVLSRASADAIDLVGQLETASVVIYIGHGGFRTENFDTTLSAETIDALQAVDDNMAAASLRASSVFVD